MVSRLEVEREIKARMGGSYEYLSESTKDSLIVTALREQGHLSVDRSDNGTTPAEPQRFGRVLSHVPTNFPLRTNEELRQDLASVIQHLKEVQAAADEARRLSDEAQQRLKQCDGELSKYDGLDRRIAEFDMASLRAGSSDALPHDLATALTHRNQASDRYERALALRDRCTSESDNAIAKLAEAQQRVQHAVSSVAVSELRSLVRELEAAEATALDLRQQIISLQLAGNSVPSDIVSRAFAPMAKVEASNEYKERWRVLMQALQSDADALLDPFQ